jgi:Gas vesicle synthesis protein GvpL/GvpF
MANRGIAQEAALYLYGISRAPAPQPAKIQSDSIDGAHPLHALDCGDFICWVSAVDREGFSQEINRNMENLEWLALHSVRHQQVVAEIAAKGAVVPARFGTMFSGEQALRKNVQARKPALEKVFSRITDADEWGVKVFAEQPPAPEAPIKVRSGKEYLQNKASRLKRRPERDDSGLQEFVHELEKIAVDSAPSGKISGVQPDLLWQATFLVPRGKRKQWDHALQQFVKKWGGSRRIEVNGPWPPYSFVSDAE